MCRNVARLQWAAGHVRFILHGNPCACGTAGMGIIVRKDVIHILPLEKMSDQVIATLRSHNIDPDTPDMCLKLDLDMKGDYGEVWLIFSNADGSIYRVEGDNLETFPISELTEPYIDNYTTSNRLQAHRHAPDDLPPEKGDMSDDAAYSIKFLA